MITEREAHRLYIRSLHGGYLSDEELFQLERYLKRTGPHQVENVAAIFERKFPVKRLQQSEDEKTLKKLMSDN